MGIEEVVTSYRCPEQNGLVERVIGTIRRECLDHIIVLNEGHLRRVLAEFVEYYNAVRPHQALARNSPVPRTVESPQAGDVIRAEPVLGGLHHRYYRAAA
jgi:putative transposase